MSNQIQEEFEIIKKIGEGTFSSVYKVKRKCDGQEYALKKIKMQNLSGKEKQNQLNEIRFMASIKSPFIISYKQAIFDEETSELYLIMEYLNGGDLFQKIKSYKKNNKHFDEKYIWVYIIQIILGLKQLHDVNILHRDFKSANIFLTREGNSAKIGDLNVSKQAKMGLLYTQTGTPYYASPEVWKDKPYDYKSDIWSLGCVIYEMCSLTTPFRANDMDTLFKKIQKGAYEPISCVYSNDLSQIIAYCLNVNPAKRPSTEILLNCSQVKKHFNQLNDTNLSYSQLFFPKNTTQLLKTFYMPSDPNYLNKMLPKSNYEPKSLTKKNKEEETEDKNKHSELEANGLSPAKKHNKINLNSGNHNDNPNQLVSEKQEQQKKSDEKITNEIAKTQESEQKQQEEEKQKKKKNLDEQQNLRIPQQIAVGNNQVNNQGMLPHPGMQLKCYQNKVLIDRKKNNKYRSISLDELQCNKISKACIQNLINPISNQIIGACLIQNQKNSKVSQKNGENGCTNRNDNNYCADNKILENNILNNIIQNNDRLKLNPKIIINRHQVKRIRVLSKNQAFVNNKKLSPDQSPGLKIEKLTTNNTSINNNSNSIQENGQGNDQKVNCNQNLAKQNQGLPNIYAKLPSNKIISTHILQDLQGKWNNKRNLSQDEGKVNEQERIQTDTNQYQQRFNSVHKISYNSPIHNSEINNSVIVSPNAYNNNNNSIQQLSKEQQAQHSTLLPQIEGLNLNSKSKASSCQNVKLLRIGKKYNPYVIIIEKGKQKVSDKQSGLNNQSKQNSKLLKKQLPNQAFLKLQQILQKQQKKITNEFNQQTKRKMMTVENSPEKDFKQNFSTIDPPIQSLNQSLES